MLVLTTLIWGISFPVIKALTLVNRLLVPDAGGWFLSVGALAPRFIIAAALLALLRLRKGIMPTRAEFRQGVLIGLFASGGMLFQTDGLRFTEASISSFLTQFMAVLIPVWVTVRHRRNPGTLVWLCSAIVIIGVGILGRVDLHAFKLGRGEWETLVGSGFFAAQVITVGGNEEGAKRTGVVTLVMFLTQAALLSVFALATMPRLSALLVVWESPGWIALTAVLGVVCTLGAFTIMNAWQPKVAAPEAGLIYCLEPVSASFFALFLPTLVSGWTHIDYWNEHLSWTLFIGGGLILGANALLNVKLEED
jgi:drug/metabolite transporter (DMT)-like permease